ncbi:1,4-dihydroxy-2-naphthoate polyprenyltransferase [Actinobacillus pleuropneumoniae]|uniref:1,4-dihydroxy-2-naphthoate octaprenyltransferase n=1 Tax=Actinobacillus pleuropneumoniae serotype 3 (strain JL03) TaxID=434271 RepID=B0BR50_ACTPJ|nr:1,4-dihydroxy-2-naphthoate polyprenyltransferase [Actinobacillus pleuropneumoniae]ABY70035.1 1,4-dihydroxy-2-naphthoate octaprenyltransferase [Actinobacillus pleuropneumoniae serovar 3 str. JL03]UKH14968.1 1,4-dihydroxy-2-naphthoate polyprenyltransferase [Actinobacillus pleuropneumoniae]UKH23159.1 1,4-dihydroxy-2-naphthoate polyprenyltransferase [Actinobacillus pleuropneumoniae]UKH44148.1 1,4-dihydroxy-2-naphthoate polyprenyltransferase [Actinobacillus pleuropneumoniae]USQ16113.1 1,4-dihydr
MDKHSAFSIWFTTARPRTLPLALASIIVGSALAYWAGHFDLITTLLAFITTILLQVLSNFANDYGDHIKGSDTKERIGPLRAIQHGTITGGQLRNAVVLLSVLSFIAGVGLTVYAYQSVQDIVVFISLGVISIIAAITYTVGKKAYGYLGLGDLFVLIFFGFVAVIGTFYLQAHSIPAMIFIPAFGCGLLSVAVLNINNLRDINQDKQAGKNTLIVRIGSQNGRVYHVMLLVLAVVSYLIFAIRELQHWYSYLFLLAVPLLAKHGLFVYRHKDPIELRPILGQMAGLALITNLLFSLGIFLG